MFTEEEGVKIEIKNFTFDFLKIVFRIPVSVMMILMLAVKFVVNVQQNHPLTYKLGPFIQKKINLGLEAGSDMFFTAQ